MLFRSSAGLSRHEADSLHLQAGLFGTPVSLAEANVQYTNKLVSFRGLITQVNIPEADRINQAYENETPESMYGAYVEAGINLINLFNRDAKPSLNLFVRYEVMDLERPIFNNDDNIGSDQKQYLVAGLSYLPVHGITIKADYVFSKATWGGATDASVMAPPGTAQNGFINVGFGYSF